MPDYGGGGGGGGYGYGGGPQDQLSLYSMLLRQPGYGGMVNPRMMFQQGQQRPPQQPQQIPWWQQQFWSNPGAANSPDRKDPRQQQGMQMGQLGMQMLQPRQPTHTGPYPWI
jgi:hypothetical protein